MDSVNKVNPKRAPNEELFTQLHSIEDELRFYQDKFKDKVVYMNSDHPDESNFWTYFYYNFEFLGLKKLVATCMVDPGEQAYKYTYDGEKECRWRLEGDGDMMSEECLGILKESDVLVTGPPFSMIRELTHKLIEYEKDFVIIGSGNLIAYKGMIEYMIEGKLKYGAGKNTTIEFYNKDENEFERRRAHWMTSFDIPQYTEDLILYRSFHKDRELYEFADNAYVLNVDKVKDIPYDYYDYMAVPISFAHQWNSEQFELIGIEVTLNDDKYSHLKKSNERINHLVVNGKNKYTRLIIKRKTDGESTEEEFNEAIHK